MKDKLNGKLIAGIVVVVAVIAAFLALSAWRYYAVVVPEQQAAAQAAQQVVEDPPDEFADSAEYAEEAANKGSLSGLNAYQSNIMFRLLACSWVSLEDETVLTFTTNSLTVAEAGHTEVVRSLALGDVAFVGEEGTAESDPDYIACLSLDGGDVTLMRLKYEVVGGLRSPVITINALGGDKFVPFESAVVDVVISEGGLSLLGNHSYAVVEKIRAYCAAVFPTVTQVIWADTLNIDVSEGRYVFYFIMNDDAATTLSVMLEKPTGRIEVAKGYTTEFAANYTTPGAVATEPESEVQHESA